MDFISIPTDNLYKFCAIVGLLLFFIPFVLLHAILEKKKILNEKLKAQIVISEIEIERMESKQKTINEKSKVLTFQEEIIKNSIKESSKIKDEILVGVMLENAKKLSKEIDNLVKESEESTYEMEKLRATNLMNLEIEKILIDRYTDYLKIIYIIPLIGFALLIYGFRKWYKLQKINDEYFKKNIRSRSRKTIE